MIERITTMKVPTIKQLRQSGWKVRVMHNRNYITENKMDGRTMTLSNFGGYTKIEVTDPAMNQTWVGEAQCSEKDNYNRRLGNSIALGRAWEQYLQDRQQEGCSHCHCGAGHE